MKVVLSLAKHLLAPLATIASASAIDVVIQKKKKKMRRKVGTEMEKESLVLFQMKIWMILSESCIQ